MKTLLLVASEAREFAGIVRRLEATARLSLGIDYAMSGQLGDRRFLLVANGPGRNLAARAVEAAMRVVSADAIVSTGFCGALDPALAAGDIVVARGVFGGAGVLSRADASPALVTMDHVVRTAAEKAKLHRETSAAAVDMESAAVAEFAASRSVRFHCVRVVTDAASESFAVDLNAARGSDGRFRVSRILLQAIRRPLTVVPELVRLFRRARAGSNKLGEYFAACHF